MHERSINLSLTIGLVLASAASLAQEAQQPALESQPVPSVGEESGGSAGEQNPAPEQDDAAKLLPAIQGIESAIRDLIAEEDKIESERQRQREVADLQAQQDMARWAFWMLIASGAGVLLTAVGVVLIWRTLLHTRDAAKHAGSAVDEAKHATKAAQEAVTVTRDLGEAQIRAYLYCKSAKYHLSKNNIAAILVVGNTGQSPASDVTITGDVTITMVGGMRSMPRAQAWLQSDKRMIQCQPIVASSTTEEALDFFWDSCFTVEDDEREHKEWVFKTGNEVAFDLTVQWTDVFAIKHEFAVWLSASIDASPYTPQKKRSSSGRLQIRMGDSRHRVIAPPDEPDEEEAD